MMLIRIEAIFEMGYATLIMVTEPGHFITNMSKSPVIQPLGFKNIMLEIHHPISNFWHVVIVIMI